MTRREQTGSTTKLLTFYLNLTSSRAIVSGRSFFFLRNFTNDRFYAFCKLLRQVFPPNLGSTPSLVLHSKLTKIIMLFNCSSSLINKLCKIHLHLLVNYLLHCSQIPLKNNFLAHGSPVKSSQKFSRSVSNIVPLPALQASSILLDCSIHSVELNSKVFRNITLPKNNLFKK